MRKRSWFNKLLFYINSLFAAALLLSYLLPYIPPGKFALISVLSLGVPLLIIINIIFLLYWLFQLKRQMLLSLIILLIGFNHVTSIYEYSGEKEQENQGRQLKFLSYNAKQFNQFGWDEDKEIPQKITRYIVEEDPDILGLQEYFKGEASVAENFPHKYINLKTKNAEFGLGIFSKYPIINSGSLDFPTISNNNGVYADVVVEEDTLRVINVHLQSFSEKPSMTKIEQEESKRVFLGMGKTFVQQENQMEMIRKLINETPHKVILMGDFNNTAYSYIYREFLDSGLKDTFKEAGNGFGRSFDFDYFPLRIDYILVDEKIEVLSFETDEIFYSDHFPIKTTINLPQPD